jgi:hypothetical protein
MFKELIIYYSVFFQILRDYRSSFIEGSYDVLKNADTFFDYAF